jgi:hypothetical protein
MGFNRRKMDDERRREAEKQAAAKRVLDPQVRADALRFVTEWNERQAQRAPLLISPTIGAAITAQHWHLWVRCSGLLLYPIDRPAAARLAPGCHGDIADPQAVVPLPPAACAVAELVKLSPRSISGEINGCSGICDD